MMFGQILLYVVICFWLFNLFEDLDRKKWVWALVDSWFVIWLFSALVKTL